MFIKSQSAWSFCILGKKSVPISGPSFLLFKARILMFIYLVLRTKKIKYNHMWYPINIRTLFLSCFSILGLIIWGYRYWFQPNAWIWLWVLSPTEIECTKTLHVGRQFVVLVMISFHSHFWSRDCGFLKDFTICQSFMSDSLDLRKLWVFIST